MIRIGQGESEATFEQVTKRFLLKTLVGEVISKIERLSWALPPGERACTRADAYELSYHMIERMDRLYEICVDTDRLQKRITTQQKDNLTDDNLNFFNQILEQLRGEKLRHMKAITNLKKTLLKISNGLVKIHADSTTKVKASDEDAEVVCHAPKPWQNKVALRNRLNDLSTKINE